MHSLSRRLRTLVVAVALVSIVATACGSDSTELKTAQPAAEAPAPDSSPGPEVPTAAPTAVPTEVPDAVTASATSVPAPSPTTNAIDYEDSASSIDEFIVPTGIVPVRLQINAIGIDAPTIDLRLTGPEPEVPTDFADTGWYTETRKPGEIGPAVIAGHIDSRQGPAVFAELDKLVVGDEITVFDDEGGERTFEVVDAGQYPKGDLPAEVFGFGEPLPELRLITCGGSFDAGSGHYRDNYVVYARLKIDA